MLSHSSAVKSVFSTVKPWASRCVEALAQSTASTRVLMSIELAGFPEYLEKDLLHHIFGLSRVAKNSQRNFQNEAVKTVKQDR